jgi:hypothetical protein
MIAVVACAAVIAYARLLHAPFLAWDDDRNIVLNPLVRSGTLSAIWSAPWFGLYVPVTSTVWAFLWNFGDGNAAIFRAYNIALHVATTVLVWRLLRRAATEGYLGAPAGARDHDDPAPARVPATVAAAIGATVFALHPLQVAAVGWVSGGRDVTAAFLSVASLHALLRGTRRAAVGATLLFILAMLAKPSAATLPVAVLAFAAASGRARLRTVAPLMSGWIACAAVDAVATSAIQSNMAGVVVPVIDRPLVAADAIGFYLLKLFAPLRLAADYGRTPAAVEAHAEWLVPTLAAVAVLGVATWGLWRRRHPAAPWAVAWVTLLGPVLGLVTFAYQRISTVADHYAYVPMIAVAGIVATLVARTRDRRAVYAAWAVAVVAGTTLSATRAGVWAGDEPFFRDMVAKNSASFSGLTNLAKVACDAGDLVRGADLSARALAVNASNPATLSVRSDCLYRAGDLDGVAAMRARLGDPAVQFALARDDAAAASFVNTLAGALFQRGEMADGFAHLCQAIALRPGDAYLRENLRDVTDDFARRGIRARCGARMAWPTFANAWARPTGSVASRALPGAGARGARSHADVAALIVQPPGATSELVPISGDSAEQFAPIGLPLRARGPY